MTQNTKQHLTNKWFSKLVSRAAYVLFLSLRFTYYNMQETVAHAGFCNEHSNESAYL